MIYHPYPGISKSCVLRNILFITQTSIAPKISSYTLYNDFFF